jgi:protein phosphatase PTC7
MAPLSFALRGTAAAARLTRVVLSRAVPPVAYFGSDAAPTTASANSGPAPVPPASPPHPDAGRFPLAFLSEATYLPHPEKAAKGGRGDDAWLMTAHALAVADGVGGWADMGVDPGNYARRLMAETERIERAAAAAASASASSGEGGGVDVDPQAALYHAWRATRVQGSSTAVMVTATHRGTLRVCNMGDSGAVLLRQERPPVTDHAPAPLRAEEAAKLWRVLTSTTPQTHEFNFPKQLAATRASDSLASAQLGELTGAGPGDVVLLASDGLFDNLHDAQLTSLLGRVSWAPCHEYVRLKRRRYAEAQSVEAAVQAEARVAGSGGGAAVAPPRGTPPRAIQNSERAFRRVRHRRGAGGRGARLPRGAV